MTLVATLVASVACVLAPLLLMPDALALFCEGQVAKGTVVKRMVTLMNISQVTNQVIQTCIPNLKSVLIGKYFTHAAHLMAVVAF